jgi:hypothetical protein
VGCENGALNGELFFQKQEMNISRQTSRPKKEREKNVSLARKNLQLAT